MTYRKPARHSLLESIRSAVADGRFARPLGRLTAAGVGALSPLLALASPTGGQVVGGQATISNPSANGTVVRQTSQNAVVNWQQFSVGSGQYVQFLQPDSSAVILNRVIGGNPSSIFGDITANGQVFLVNPNGILFAPGASLDVGGLVASTQDISTADFMAGRYNFTKAAGAPDATVINQGTITANGGYVVLAGDYVENDGVINAQSGTVYLAAGNSATLTLNGNQLISYTVNGATLARLAGVANTGEITAAGGAVVMTADVANALTATAVNNSGFIAAHSIQNESGVIVLAAEGGALENSGTLDASATQAGVAGGTILIRGNEKTELTPTSVITTAGDGAKGGFIDLSGHDLAIHGQVTAGKGGSLLLDPTTINIINGSASVGGTNVNSVGIGFIQNKLNAGSNVTLVATSAINNAGGSASPRTITATATPAAGTRFRLATGTVVTGSQCLTGARGVCVGVSSFPSVTVGTGNINLNGLTINVKGAFIASAGQGSVTLGPVSAGSGIFVIGGTIQVNGNLTSSVGQLDISANRGVATGAFIKTASGVKLKAGSVNLNLGGSYGGKISVGTVSAGSENITLNYNTLNSPTSPEKIVTGNLTGRHINVTASGPKSTIDINGSITAVSAAGPVGVQITDNVTTAHGSGHITVNGNITLSGKTASSASMGPYDLPTAARLTIAAGGSAASATRTVTVNGNVDVTGIAGTYSRNSTCECGGPVRDRTQSGKGGVATAFITVAGSLGAASVNGSMNIKGPDAIAAVEAHTVTVNGNISVTGSGHHVSRSITPSTTGVASYTSSNSAGQARLELGTVPPLTSTGVAGVSATVKAGNITVSGKGVAGVALLGSHVSAGNITATAAAAKGSVKQHGNVIGNLHCAGSNCNSAVFYRGIDDAAMQNGSIDGGRANVLIGGGAGFNSGSNGIEAVSITTGALSVNGAGQGRIALFGKTIQTQGLSAVATKGTEKGSGSSQSGVTAVTTYKHSFDINGGEADIKIRSGNSGSASSGVLTRNGGPVTIAGNVSATGPTAVVDIKAASIKIGGTLTVMGSGGGSLKSHTVVTPPTGGYSTSFSGPGHTTAVDLQGGLSGSVSVAGMTTVKGPGLVGALMLGGTVKLHGLSASADAIDTYTVKDTRKSPNAVTFNAGSVAMVIDEVKSAGGAVTFASASDTGDVTLNAKGNVVMPSRIKIGGKLSVKAAGTVFGNSDSLVTRFDSIDSNSVHANSGGQHGGGPSAGFLPALGLNATSAAVVAGGSIDLTGANLKITKTLQLVANKDIILSGVTINTGTLIATASGTIHNGGAQGSITANALALEAKKDITLTSTQVNIGNGSVSSVHGDTLLLEGLAGLGIAPTATAPNGALIAGGALSLGGLKLTGSYLLLQAKSVSVLGPVSVPKGALVQVVPFDDTTAINFENTTTTAAGFDLANLGFVSLFGSGVTFAFGDGTESGAVTIGSNGPINIGSDNLIIVSTGDVTGLSTVTSTGIVASLFSVLGPPVPPVTAGEIDPNAGSTGTGLGDQTDKKHLGQVGNVSGGGGGGTVTQDTGTASVCH